MTTRSQGDPCALPQGPPQWCALATIEREHPRYAVEAAIILHVATGLCEGRTRNLSRGGLCANIADALPVGTECDISIVLMFDDNQHSEPLRLPGRVVWSTELDNAHHVGVAFRPLDATLQQHLAVYLRYLEQKGTERRPRDLPVDERFQ